jgi:Domain of unknown function (DUF4159)
MRKTAAVAFVALFLGLGIFRSRLSSDQQAHDPEFVYARVRYHMTPDAIFVPEVPWHHDYDFSDRQFPSVVAEVSGIRSSSTAYQIVDIDSPDLFNYPFAYLCEPGYLQLTPKDAVNLREYLDRGGFLLIDDLRTAAYSLQTRTGPEDDIGHFQMEMRKVYPDRTFVRLDLSDPVFNTFYKIKTLNMIPPYFFPGQRPVQFLGLRDPHGTLQMVINDNNDISEYWEWLNKGEKSLHEASTSLEFGINYLMYAMSH